MDASIHLGSASLQEHQENPLLGGFFVGKVLRAPWAATRQHLRSQALPEALLHSLGPLPTVPIAAGLGGQGRRFRPTDDGTEAGHAGSYRS